MSESSDDPEHLLLFDMVPNMLRRVVEENCLGSSEISSSDSESDSMRKTLLVFGFMSNDSSTSSLELSERRDRNEICIIVSS